MEPNRRVAVSSAEDIPHSCFNMKHDHKHYSHWTSCACLYRYGHAHHGATFTHKFAVSSHANCHVSFHKLKTCQDETYIAPFLLSPLIARFAKCVPSVCFSALPVSSCQAFPTCQESHVTSSLVVDVQSVNQVRPGMNKPFLFCWNPGPKSLHPWSRHIIVGIF